jgi:hypothetical protein
MSESKYEDEYDVSGLKKPVTLVGNFIQSFWVINKLDPTKRKRRMVFSLSFI